MEYPPETGWGGIGTYTYNLAHGLTKLGHEVYVISSSLSDSREYMDENVHVYRIKTFKTGILGAIYYSLNVLKKIMELIKGHNINVIEASALFGESLGFSFTKIKPLVTSLHTPSFIYNQLMNQTGLKAWRWQQLEKFSLMRADRIISSTKVNAELICKYYKMDRSKIRVVPHGINPKKYHRVKSNLREKSNLVDNKIVLFVGRLERRKGVHILVDSIPQVVKRIPNAYFIFVGRDTKTAPSGRSFKEYIYEKTRENGCLDHIRMVGHVSERELVEHYSLCDVFVAPSLYESFGLVYLEAMACSKPVIGTSVGGIPEVIANKKTGILVPPGDNKALGEAIINLLADDPKREQMGLNARREVEKSFTDVSMAEKTLEVFRELI